MNKLVYCLLFTAVSAVSFSHAQSVVETFNYTGDSAVATTATTGTGEQGNWGSFWISNNVSGTSDALFASGSLSAPSGYTFTPADNRIAYDPADATLSAAAIFEIADAAKIDFGVNSTIYVSFLIRAYSNNATSGRISFQDDTGTTLFAIGELSEPNDDADNGKLGIDVASARNFSTAYLDGPAVDGASTDNLVVLKIETSAGGTDQLSASFWNSSSSNITAEPSTWDVTHSLTSSLVAAGLRFDFEDGFSNLDTSFDEIRVGTSFSAVTGIGTSGGGGSLGYVSVTPVGGEVIIEFQVETTNDLGTPFVALDDVTVEEPVPGTVRVRFPSTEPQLFLKLNAPE